MQHQQYIQESLSHPAFLMLACLVDEPKTATALHEAVVQATGQVIEPGAFSRMVARLERRGWIAGDDGWERMRRYHITAFGLLALQQVEAKYQRNQVLSMLETSSVLFPLFYSSCSASLLPPIFLVAERSVYWFSAPHDGEWRSHAHLCKKMRTSS